MEKHTARIDNWFVVGNCLWGKVTEHTLREFDPNNIQRTSQLVSIDKDKGVAETENTRYKLGVKERKPLL